MVKIPVNEKNFWLQPGWTVLESNLRKRYLEQHPYSKFLKNAEKPWIMESPMSLKYLDLLTNPVVDRKAGILSSFRLRNWVEK